jgi:hypothetical protein
MVMTDQGSVYRRCGCTDPVTGRQLGGRCPRLAGSRHGSWYVRLELPAALDGHRRRIRRGGYPSRKAAAAVLARLRGPRPGDAGGRMLTVGDWLAHWLASRTSPAASTVCGYTAHVRLYLAPYLGQVLLAELFAAHVQAMFTAIIRQHEALGSPVSAATLNRIRATLRAALNAAIRRGLSAVILSRAARWAGLGSMRHTVSDPGPPALSTVYSCGMVLAGGPMGAVETGVGGYIAAWQPSPVPAGAARFARTVVAAAAPDGRQRAKNLLWAAGKLAGYAIGPGLDPVPEVLLHPPVTGRFTAHGPGLSGPPHAAGEPAVPGRRGGPAAAPGGPAAAPRAGQGTLQPGRDRRLPRPRRRAAHRRGGCARRAWSARAPAPG